MDQVLKKTRSKLVKLNNNICNARNIRNIYICNNTMVAVENMTDDKFRVEMTAIENAIANQKNYFFHDVLVRDNQIMLALVHEVGLKFTPKKGYLYKVIKEVANKARRRGLLINPIDGELYSKKPNPNTDEMKPSAMGWAQTQGILKRELHEASEYLRRVHLSRTWGRMNPLKTK